MDTDELETAEEDTPGESGMGVELYREYWGRGEEIRALEAEKEHNRRVFGQTYREVNGRDHKYCIILCLDPGQRKPVRCPCCYGRAAFRPMRDAPGIDPEPGRWERFSAWAGTCIGTFAAALWEAVTFLWRVSQDHRVALIRDVLQDAMDEGLIAEVRQVCPECEAHEEDQLDQADTTMTAEVVEP